MFIKKNPAIKMHEIGEIRLGGIPKVGCRISQIYRAFEGQINLHNVRSLYIDQFSGMSFYSLLPALLFTEI